MKYTTYIIAFLLLPFLSAAQSRIESTGKLPKDFTQKARSEKGSSQKKSKLDKVEDSFTTQSKYSIKQLMRSGVVLFNDPATVYLNDVLANIPYTSKKRSKQPRVYALNSTAVNAFATNEGVICVTLGLLARMENEAQLAFILSHEIMHIEHNHSVKTFVNKYELNKKKKKRKERKVEDKENDNVVGNSRDFDPEMLKRSIFSQKLEVEADDEGLELFLKSKYSTESLGNVFEVLFYADMPFEDSEMETSLFDNGDYKLPEDKWPSELSPVRPFEHYNDEVSTHPSAFKRQESLAKKIKGNNIGKGDYIVGESRFLEAKSLAQYQLPYLHLEEGNYIRAIYTAHVLDQKNIYGSDFKKVIGKSLYQEMKHRDLKGDDEVKAKKDEKEKDIRGYIQLLDHAITNMDNKELVTLATSYNLHIAQEFSKDKELAMIVDDCFKEMKEQYNSLAEFKMANKTIYWQHAFSSPGISKKAESEFAFRSKIKFTGKDLLKDMTRKDHKRILKKGQALGLKNVLIVNPAFVSLNKKSTALQSVRSEKKEAELLKSFKDISRKTRVKASIIDPAVMSTKDASKMNDLNEINKYVAQVLGNSNNPGVIPTNYGKIQEISKKYKTKNLLIPMVISRKKGTHPLLYFYGLYYYLAFPPALIHAVTNNRTVLYASILINSETGETTIVDMKEARMKDTKLHLDIMVYNTLHQLGARK